MNRLPVVLPLLLLLAGSVAFGGLGAVSPSGTTTHTPTGGGPIEPARSLASFSTPSPATAVPASIIPSLLNVPGASTPTSMTYDSGDGYMLLVTPTANSTISSTAMMGTWSYRAGTWTELSPSSAPPPASTPR